MNLPAGKKYCECGCKTIIDEYDQMGVYRRFVSGHNSKGSGNPHYGGGKEKHKEFKYKTKTDHSHPNADKYGHMRLHVWLYTTYHKCCMLKWSQIHHIDGDTLNNEISNLVGVMRSTHRRSHMTVDMSNRVCKLCESTETSDRHWYRYEDGHICTHCKYKLSKDNMYAG